VSLSDLARREAGAALVEALDAVSAALPRAVDLARQEGRDAERAAVVAWLREAAYTTLYDARAWDVADNIERGEHRREEGP
jgi:hypothetical protein